MPEERSKSDVRRELVQHLKILHSDFEGIIRKYSLNVQAQMEEMIRMVEEESLEENQKVFKQKDIDNIVTNIRKMKTKPNRGRLKDIKRIQALLDDIDFILSTYE
jgi:hypothetical protein